MEMYDSIIIGAGPAGLSAAIYLARYNRSVLVIDDNNGRSTEAQTNENYLGFPDGIKATELRKLGKLQAEKFGVAFVNDKTINISKKEYFSVECEQQEYFSKTIIYATGVTDIFPQFLNWEKYVGKSLFWCITCDGHKTINKKIAIVGQTDDAACTAMQFLNYSNNLLFITNCIPQQEQLSDKWKERLSEANIPIIYGVIDKVEGENGMLKEVYIANEKYDIEYIFSQQGSTANTQLARDFEVKLDKNGYIEIDLDQRTNIPFFYAAGDVTNLFNQQVVTAAHEGATAAQSANYDLYDTNQRM